MENRTREEIWEEKPETNDSSTKRPDYYPYNQHFLDGVFEEWENRRERAV